MWMRNSAVSPMGRSMGWECEELPHIASYKDAHQQYFSKPANCRVRLVNGKRHLQGEIYSPGWCGNQKVSSTPSHGAAANPRAIA